jgi:hypothetical protein
VKTAVTLGLCVSRALQNERLMGRFLADSPHFWIKTSCRTAVCEELCLTNQFTIDSVFFEKDVDLPSNGKYLRILTVLQMNVLSARAYLVAIVQDSRGQWRFLLQKEGLKRLAAREPCHSAAQNPSQINHHMCRPIRRPRRLLRALEAAYCKGRHREREHSKTIATAISILTTLHT